MWFDVIIGNPPYQSPDNSHSLWQDFIIHGMNYLRQDGWMIQITPRTWTLNSKGMLNLFKQYQLQYVQHSTNEYFPHIYKDTGFWILQKTNWNPSHPETVIEQHNFSKTIDIHNYSVLPHDFSDDHWELFTKVVAKTQGKTWNDFHILNESDLHLLQHKKEDYILFSKRRFNEYYKILGWHSRHHGSHNLPYGSQIIGLNISQYDKEEQRNIINMFCHSLYEYWHDLLGGKNSNNILRILNALPVIDGNEPYYAELLFSRFIKSNKSSVKKEDSSSTKRSPSRIKQTGEVFTPKELVVQVLYKIPESVWKNPSLKWLDMACGNGQFLIEIYERLRQYHSRTHILSSMLYGIDIMKDNVEECSKRLHATLDETNIVCANSLLYDFSFIRKDSGDFYINYADGIFF